MISLDVTGRQLGAESNKPESSGKLSAGFVGLGLAFFLGVLGIAVVCGRPAKRPPSFWLAFQSNHSRLVNHTEAGFVQTASLKGISIFDKTVENEATIHRNHQGKVIVWTYRFWAFLRESLIGSHRNPREHFCAAVVGLSRQYHCIFNYVGNDELNARSDDPRGTATVVLNSPTEIYSDGESARYTAYKALKFFGFGKNPRTFYDPISSQSKPQNPRLYKADCDQGESEAC